MADTANIHATCISIGGKGVLLLGDSGSGKSDVALRLIDGGALLVADDRVDVARHKNSLAAAPPKNIAGKMEARGVGILTLPYAEHVPLKLAVSLVARDKVERLPDAQFFDCLGVKLPLLSLYPFDESSCAKIRLALQHKD